VRLQSGDRLEPERFFFPHCPLMEAMSAGEALLEFFWGMFKSLFEMYVGAF